MSATEVTFWSKLPMRGAHHFRARAISSERSLPSPGPKSIPWPRSQWQHVLCRRAPAGVVVDIAARRGREACRGVARLLLLEVHRRQLHPRPAERHLLSDPSPEVKSTGLAQTFGQFYDSNRNFQSHRWANLITVGSLCHRSRRTLTEKRIMRHST